jgi:DNA-binding protein HU-beta
MGEGVGAAMTKAEIIDEFAKWSNVRKAEAERMVRHIFDDIISAALIWSHEIKIAGFGIFSLAQHKARTECNPNTGEAIAIPVTCSVKFKLGRQLKEALN